VYLKRFAERHRTKLNSGVNAVQPHESSVATRLVVRSCWAHESCSSTTDDLNIGVRVRPITQCYRWIETLMAHSDVVSVS
jgi:hypothetical protein